MIAPNKTELKEWVHRMEEHFQPANVHWCTGSQEEYDQLCQQMLKDAAIAYLEKFAQPAPAIALTNMLHLAELELAGRPSTGRAKPAEH